MSIRTGLRRSPELGFRAPARSCWSRPRLTATCLSEVNKVASDSLRVSWADVPGGRHQEEVLFIYFGNLSSVCFTFALPRLFCKLNKVLVMRLDFSEAVEKRLRNGAKVTGFFFFLSFFLKNYMFATER